ncbi:hypothetical protein [Phaeobacter inhibens]|uniref:hypothetical protein n=1 Tax=Phaeobacter inhibens TaxID=221822 RepID=UPI000CA176FA|nr:hypothetical protein [Phaeobacter inhibens]AUQ67267.1 hypothetical protein PhaeoP78_02421 [Phaeobacter inhibens]
MSFLLQFFSLRHRPAEGTRASVSLHAYGLPRGDQGFCLEWYLDRSENRNG